MCGSSCQDTEISAELRRLHRIFYSTATSVLTDAACALEDYESQLVQLRTENEMLRAVIAQQGEKVE